jgi:hypothetical protein
MELPVLLVLVAVGAVLAVLLAQLGLLNMGVLAGFMAVVVVVLPLAVVVGQLALALYALFGRVTHVHSHQLAQEIYNESLYTN